MTVRLPPGTMIDRFGRVVDIEKTSPTSLLQRLKARFGKAWDEALHPRVPGGHAEGGQFTNVAAFSTHRPADPAIEARRTGADTTSIDTTSPTAEESKALGDTLAMTRTLPDGSTRSYQQDLVDGLSRKPTYDENIPDTPERIAQREQWLDEMWQTGGWAPKSVAEEPWRQITGERPLEMEKQAWFVLGLPGSGKSAVFADAIKQEHPWAFTVDPDESKFINDRFDHGVGAASIHEESSFMAKSLQQRAQRAGKDLIIPKVGDNAANLEKAIRKLQEDGYVVHLKYNEVTTANALKRVGTRWKRTGRFVDTNYVQHAGHAVPKAWEHLKTVSDVDWEHYNNDAASARLVARGTNRRKK